MPTHPIQQYLNVRSTTGPSFGPHNERLAFLSDVTGTPQVWTINGEGPQQKTYFDERVSFVSWSPTRLEFIFGMDKGANERDQLYRFDVSDGVVNRLTDEPEAKHEWGGWNSDGSKFAFGSNRRVQAVYDVFIQDRDARDDETKRIYEGEARLTFGGWSPGDTRLLIREEHASFDQDLYVLEIDSGEITHITPSQETARYHGLNWGPDGKSIYLSTDENADTMYLGRLDLDTLSIDVVDDGSDWNIETVQIDQSSKRVVYSRNINGYSELATGELTDPTTIEPLPTPDLPKGVIAGWDPDSELTITTGGEQFAVSYTAPDLNPSIFVTTLESGETHRWTFPSTAGIPQSHFQHPDLIHYETFDEREIPAFFTCPQETEPPYPVIVDIHGGPEGQRRPQFYLEREHFLDAGFAVFEPNVRGSAGYGKEYIHLDDVRNRMDSVADVKEGVEWLHRQDTIDPERIVAYGRSYGGFMVLASLTEYPELWAAGIDFVGIANFITFLENTSEWRQDHRAAEYGSPQDDREFLEKISPVNNIQNIEAPLMVLHGENDPRVPVEESRQVAEVASEHVSVETLYFDDEGHQFTKLANRIKAHESILEFLNKHVK